MKRPVLVSLIVASALALIVLVLTMRSALHREAAQPVPAGVRNITVSIGNEKFELKDGLAEQPAAPGSSTRNTARIVGEPALGDATGDAKPDAALVIVNEPGGSGTFYYAVVAVDHDGSYRATNVIALGDRISPQSIDFSDGHFVYRFLERKPDESMADAPTIETTVPIHVDGATDTISVGS